MVRTFFSILMMLSTAIAGMLLWQWQWYSENRDKTTEIINPHAVQYLKITHTKGAVTVEQTIKGLPAGTYTVENQNIQKWSCIENQTSNCTPKEKAGKTVRSNGKQLRFSYSFPLNSNKPSFVLMNWSLRIKNISIDNTRVEIIESGNRKGMWAAGAPVLANKVKKYIDYYVFEGNAESFPLYFHSGKLSHRKLSNKLEIYGELAPDQASRLKQAVAEISDFPFLAIIATDQYPEYKAGNLMIISSLQGLEQELLTQYLQLQYPFLDKQETWLQSYIGQLLFSQKTQSEKVHLINKSIEEELSADQQSRFIEILKEEKGRIYSAQLLDALLSKAAGQKTSFFTENRFTAKSVIPLYFIENKNVLVNRNEINGERAIYIKNQRFYPFETVASSLGYAINMVNPTHYLITRDSNSYRFYLDKSSFLFNDKTYGISENPFLTLNEKVYIQEIWLNEIFQTFVRENKNEIEIVEL
ncbi:hypothetical protein D0469_04240 [Peribacillus saganii]|uniref:Copper amine oxidase-like N-terminal domain-containing protein n=1 Tax=Peribacillus saganii TaxID=2303992 RepID=A0A372LUB9_9BACI|nr:hypothetical protein [Peribacillus saganii]RFU71154.1 hypothetical protein D0469_04240 [Peribacillus saganii]